MDARAKTVKEILHTGDQYLVPFFQRHYSWKRKNWDRLWADLTALLEDDDPKAQHFMGPLVCTPTDHVPGEVTPYQLIDGQQRLTTLSILLAAIAHVARAQGLTDLADEVIEDYLVHKRRKGFQRFKVVPRTGDREVLHCVVEGKVEKDFRRDGIMEAWRVYRKRIEAYLAGSTAAEQALRKLLSTVADRLSLVVITITGENPYEIFESLNSTGLPLEQSDLIRNFIFMQVPLAQQDEFQQQHWQEFERLFEADGAYPSLSQTSFYRNYIMRLGSYSKRHETFVDFKRQMKAADASPAIIASELKRYAVYEAILRRPATCGQLSLQRALLQIEMLDIATAHPLVMELLARRDEQRIGEAELLGCLNDLCSFVLRRSLCSETTRPYSRWFVSALKDIKSSPRADLQAFWLSKGWPDDEALTRHVQEFALYRREKAKARLILEAIEAGSGHKELASTSKATIEHVMPQTISDDAAGKAWKQMLGPDWKRVHADLLHSLGNLTLSAYNPNLSKHSFERKKAILAESKLDLNRYFAPLASWNEQAIRDRAAALIGRVAQLWPRPSGGPRYVAPVPAAGGGKVSRRELFGQYWAVAVDRWDGHQLPFKVAKVRPWEWLGFRIGIKGFNYYAWINPKARWIAVGFSTTGQHNKNWFNRLQAKAPEIERAFGDPLVWDERPSDSYTHASVFRRDTNPAEDKTWDDQHDWLLRRLVDLDRAVRPQVEALRDGADEADEADED